MKYLIPVLIAFLVFAAPVWADQIGLHIEPESQTVISGTITAYNLTITNYQPLVDDFTISVDGPYTEWKIPSDFLVEIGSGRNVTTDLTFLPGEREGKYVYTVRVSSRKNPLLSKTISFNLNVNLPPLFRLNDLTLEKEGGKVTPTLVLWTRKNAYVDVVFEVRNSDNQTLGTFQETVLVNGDGTISTEIPINDFMAGTYTVLAITEEGNLSRGFEVEAVHDVEETSESLINPLYKEFVVTVTNNGNTPEEGYTLTQTITPEGDSVTAFITQPTSCSDIEGGQACSFTIESIGPGESKQVIYRMEFWPSYTKVIASFIVIMFLGVFYYIRISKPRLRKKSVRKGQNEHMVVIEVKGPKIRDVKDVTVKDVVSPLGEITGTCFNHQNIRPVMRRTEKGTELIWKLGSMVKKEERLLAYRLKTTLEGSIKMPHAVMRFMNHKGEKNRVYSKNLLIE